MYGPYLAAAPQTLLAHARTLTNMAVEELAVVFRTRVVPVSILGPDARRPRGSFRARMKLLRALPQKCRPTSRQRGLRTETSQ